jgi:hypothetical protein
MLGACASSMSSVPVKGSDGDVARLAGEWKGEFEGVNDARAGTIDFSFEMGRHTADAKVVMTIDGKPIQLKVAVLNVDDSQVAGRMEPYLDPTCDCEVEGQFEGALSAGYIVGTYSMEPNGGEKRVGNWSAERIAE